MYVSMACSIIYLRNRIRVKNINWGGGWQAGAWKFCAIRHVLWQFWWGKSYAVWERVVLDNKTFEKIE
jgi:hypothetical protein